MRRFLAAVAVAAVALASSGAAEASPISFQFSNLNNTSINFNGSGNFNFTNNLAGYSFGITGVGGALSSTVIGTLGNIGGTFTIGAISNPFPGILTAPVTGVGTFNLFDAANQMLSFAVSWVNITQTGTANNLNIAGALNLTGGTYGGVDPNFLAIVNAIQTSATISYSFNPAVALTALATSANSTSYAGTFAATTTQVPEPASLTLLGSGLLGALAVARRRRKNAKKE